jgi:hypothetical protein
MADSEAQPESENPETGQSQSLPESFQHQHETKAKTENAGQRHHVSNNHKNRRERLRSWTKRWRVILGLIIPSIFSAAVLGVIILQSGIYRRQADLMDGQLNEMRESTVATKIAAKAAQDSARDMKSALDFSKELSRLDQRAWVSVAEISGFPEIDKPFDITLTFKNSGKTFARRVVTYPIPEFRRGSDIPDFADRMAAQFPFPYSEDQRAPLGYEYVGSDLLIAPNGTMLKKVRAQARLTQDAINLYKIPQNRLYVFGRINYTDIFKVDHITQYCWYLSFDEERGWQYRACGLWNDAD